MKPELEKLCTEYIANRDAVSKAFIFDDKALHAVCANIFCACGQTADTDRLKDCRKLIKKQTKPFSRFRSKKVRSILASMLSLGETPENRMALAGDYYSMLKKQFKKTEYLVLTAFLFTDLADKPLTEDTVTRGKEIYRMMNQKHRLLTDKTDSVFAMLLACSEKTSDELISEMEACYAFLKGSFSSGSGRQAASQILAMAAGAPEEKAQRLIDLYNALKEAGIKYGHSDELAPLAALSLSDTPVPVLAEEIREADEFLKEQKGYGSRETEEEKRAVHAVMIISDQYAGTGQVNVTVATNTLDMLHAKEIAARISLFTNALQFLVKLIPGADEQIKTDEQGKADQQTEADGQANKAESETAGNAKDGK